MILKSATIFYCKAKTLSDHWRMHTIIGNAQKNLPPVAGVNTLRPPAGGRLRCFFLRYTNTDARFGFSQRT